MKKIAVICAPIPERNTGMVTVDLSAHCILKEIMPDEEITFYVHNYDSVPYDETELPFTYLNIAKNIDKYLSSDCFIFWGDFAHARSYWSVDKLWTLKNSLPKDQFEEVAKTELKDYFNTIFLGALPKEQLKKVIVFGSTIITNDASDQISDDYSHYFNRFFKNIGAVYFRDALSAARISPLRNHQPTLSIDCALLLQEKDIKKLPNFTRVQSQKDIGVFLGRSTSRIMPLLFSKIVGWKMGQKCTWVPWLEKGPKMRLVARVFGYKITKERISPGDLLSMVSGHSLIITDTYHLCVNAWNLGIPTICIGSGANTQETSISDKKKEIIYDMYGAKKFYVFTEKIRYIPSLFSEASRVVKVISNNPLSDKVIENIATHRNMALERLKFSISKILNDK